jgi:hypothetical protein
MSGATMKVQSKPLTRRFGSILDLWKPVIFGRIPAPPWATWTAR